VTKVGEIKASLLRRENLPRISKRARRTVHRRSTHPFYAMDLTGSLNVLNGASLSPLSKKRGSKRRIEGSPPSSYSMPFKPRRKDNLMDAYTWRLSSMASHYKPCWT